MRIILGVLAFVLSCGVGMSLVGSPTSAITEMPSRTNSIEKNIKQVEEIVPALMIGGDMRFMNTIKNRIIEVQRLNQPVKKKNYHCCSEEEN